MREAKYGDRQKAEDTEQRGYVAAGIPCDGRKYCCCAGIKKQETYIQQRLAYCQQQLKSRKASETPQCSFQALSQAASDTERTMGIYRSIQDIHNEGILQEINEKKKKAQPAMLTQK